MSLFKFPLRFLFVYTNPTAYFKMKEIKEVNFRSSSFKWKYFNSTKYENYPPCNSMYASKFCCSKWKYNNSTKEYKLQLPPCILLLYASKVQFMTIMNVVFNKKRQENTIACMPDQFCIPNFCMLATLIMSVASI